MKIVKGLTKGLVADFVYAVKDKALNAIDAKGIILFVNAMDEYLEENKVLKEALHGIDFYVKEIDNALEVVVEICGKDLSCYGLTNNVKQNNIKHGAAYALFENHQPKGSKMAKVKELWASEYKATNDSYYAIISAVRNAKSGKQALEMVNELGFDTSWILEQAGMSVAVSLSSLKKENLFPCGDNK